MRYEGPAEADVDQVRQGDAHARGEASDREDLCEEQQDREADEPGDAGLQVGADQSHGDAGPGGTGPERPWVVDEKT
jgi:hypothetical protein